jgi:hypothetical protein
MVDVNKQRMIDNQTYVKHILQLAEEDNLVDVETDSSYNNRPQPGCETATQTLCPLVEQCTTKKLVINIETASVNCPWKNCEHNAHTFKRHYSTDESMASTESKFVGKNPP